MAFTVLKAKGWLNIAELLVIAATIVKYANLLPWSSPVKVVARKVDALWI